MPQLKLRSKETRAARAIRPTNRALSEQRAHLARELVETLLFIGLVFLIVHLTIQSFRVEDLSMSPAVQPGQYVLVNTQAFFLGGPSRGDVVVVDDPHNLSVQLLRRVIAVPGDTIALTATQVLVNGVPLSEPYITVPQGEAMNSAPVPPEKLGPNQYFVLEDNRTASDSTTNQPIDSRSFGVVPRGNIVGKAVMVFWPLGNLHWVASAPGVPGGSAARLTEVAAGIGG